jgi:hypothetical protein
MDSRKGEVFGSSVDCPFQLVVLYYLAVLRYSEFALPVMPFASTDSHLALVGI